MAINLLGGTRMPGLISGYGGGTFDLDGTQVTPVDDGFPQPSMPRRNVMAETVRPQEPQQTNQQPQRRRPNFFEVVGRIGDVMALMGGRDPLYERFAAQERAAEEEAMQRNVLADFLSRNEALQPFAPLLNAGMGVPQIAQLASLGQGPKDEMTPLMREVAAATGFQPGTPEYRAALATEMNNRRLAGALNGSPDTGYQVNPLYRPLGQPPAAPAPAPAAPAQGQGGNVVTMGDLQRMAPSFPNADAMMRWMRGNRVAVRVSSPQEALSLPSGTQLILPDGSPGAVP